MAIGKLKINDKK